jgi:predicted metal-dependent hydrolase
LKKSIPQLQNKIYLDQREINYILRYSSNAKYLRLQINHSNELEVILPKRYKHEKAEDFILQKKDWILKHLKERMPGKYFFLGEEIKILINYDLFLKKPYINYQRKKLLARIPSGHNGFNQDEIYNVWIKHKAKIYLPERIKNISERTGFSYSKITIRAQKTRWGSCTSGKKLSFNYKLMRYRKEVIDYVIIHELCHLKEMNHSEKFWKLVESFCTDYKKLRREL